jgi:hypothetical protein
MSKKIMNPLRWRFLAIVASLHLGIFILGYFALPTDKRHGFIVFELAVLPVGLIGVGVIISLWRRFPVSDDEDKDS